MPDLRRPTPDRPPLPRSVVGIAVVVAILVVAAVVGANAPANWLARYVAGQTDGVILLADADGTVWSGSAVVALGSPSEASGGAPAAVGAASRLALPGRVTWTLEMTRTLAPVLHLTHDGVLLQPLAVRLADGGGVTFDAGAAAMSAAILRLAGAPLNTLLPEGRCELRWNGLTIDRKGAVVGGGTLDVQGFALAASPVRPLGDYRVTWTSGGDGFAWRVATVRGPLALDGDGRIAGSRVRARVVLRAAADAPAGVAAQLGPLLDVVGRRGPNEAVIEVGTS